MISRRSHYEAAFEAYLRQRRIPYLAAEPARRRVPGHPGVKLFDYVVHADPDGRFLVDVKGRKVTRSPRSSGWDTWVTAADLDGLTRWQAAFGDGFSAAFVFAHWLAGVEWPTPAEAFEFAGRAYVFGVVLLEDYLAHSRRRSPRWRTVCVPRGEFRCIVRAPREFWPSGADDGDAPRASIAALPIGRDSYNS